MSELTYTRNGDYLFPNLILTEADKIDTPLGKYALMRQNYLKENRPGLFSRLLLSGKLMPHLLEIEKTAQTRMESLMTSLKKQYNVTEELKAKDQMNWVAQMNSLQHLAEETILSELIYN